MAYKVFISHSSRDTWVAEQIEKHIHECGARTFLDEKNIEIGDRFATVIRQELNNSDELLVIFTPWALGRLWVWMEIGVIWGREKRIVAVLHGITPKEFLADQQIPPEIKDTDIVEINDLKTYFEQLRQRVSEHKSELT